MPSRRPCSRALQLSITLLSLIWVAPALVLLSCSGERPSSAGGEPRGPASGRLRIAVIPKGTTHTFWKSIHAGARRAERGLKADGIDIEVIWQGPLVEDDRETQRQVMETFIGQNIHGIVLAPLDDHAMVAPVNQAMAAGKPVVIFDSGLKGENYISYVATDNYKGGALAAERMSELLSGAGGGEGKKVLLLRYQQGSASTTQREQGFIETLAKRQPGAVLVPPGLQQYSGATVGRAQNASETLLNAYPDVAGIFCPNESSATGMLQALANSPLAGKVFFVGFDANEKLVKALEEGQIHGLILQDPVRMGDLAVRTMVTHLRDEKVEPVIDTGVYLITRENMKEPAMQALLKPDLSILDG
jgi:ribose transport system substrate-binding protein